MVETNAPGRVVGSSEPFECYSKTGMYRAEPSPTGGWIISEIGFHGDSAFADWTDTRDDAVRLARMHANMEFPA